jgi:hypothetical protein
LSIWWNIKEQTKEPTQEDLWAIISPKEVIVPNQAIMEQCELGDISNLIHIIRNIVGNSKGVTIEKLQEELAVPITVEELQQAIPTLITWKDGNNVVHINVGDPVLSYDNELQSILDSASRDEQGRLLAPNGKPSNLTERQYAQVRTKAFIDWFGDWINDPENASKVVDENGEPKVVYHGTNATFNTFDFNYLQTLEGFHFINNKNREANYGKNVLAVFLNIKNLYDTSEINVDGALNKSEGAIWSSGSNSRYVIKNNPNFIKSATDNIGTFSREDNNIYHHRSNIQAAINIIERTKE